MGLRGLAYGAYERRLVARLDTDRIPHHVGVILDGNRRWARMYGDDDSDGHRRGADKIRDFLGWCEQVDVEACVGQVSEVAEDDLEEAPVAGGVHRVGTREPEDLVEPFLVGELRRLFGGERIETPACHEHVPLGGRDLG